MAEANGNGNGSSGPQRLTWAIVGAAACYVVMEGIFRWQDYVMDRMDRMFDRISLVERLLAEHEGRIKERE